MIVNDQIDGKNINAVIFKKIIKEKEKGADRFLKAMTERRLQEAGWNNQMYGQTENGTLWSYSRRDERKLIIF